MDAKDLRRRWFGLLFLVLAGGMLVWGLTLLDRHLKGWWFVIYWLACLGFTLAAMAIAWLDWRAIRKPQRADAGRRTGAPPT